VLIHDLRTDVRTIVPLEAFERAVAQGGDPWTP
jgi:hypothetical protein